MLLLSSVFTFLFSCYSSFLLLPFSSVATLLFCCDYDVTTRAGPNVLYANNGDGTFARVPMEASTATLAEVERVMAGGAARVQR